MSLFTQGIDSKGNIIKNNNFVKVFKPQNWSNIKEANKKKNINNRTEILELPQRQKWCPDFKCQRAYMTCTDNNKPRITEKDIKDPPQIIPPSEKI